MRRRLALALFALTSCARSGPLPESSSSLPIDAGAEPIVAVADAGAPRADDAGLDADAERSVDASVGDGGDELPRELDGMLLVPAGPFTMGADRGGEEDEHPAHVVTLPAFYLDRTEVTNAAYDECVRAKACPPPDANTARANHAGDVARFRGPNQPVVGVSFHDGAAYCAFRQKRLPREAEWEKAARGTDARRFPWGNEPPTPERAVYGRAINVGSTDDVGSHPSGRGPYGHEDLGGNVWEWIADEYDPLAYKRSGAPRGEPGTCPEILKAQDELRREGKQGYTGSNPIPTICEHPLRGGAFNYDGPGLRAMNRVHHPGTFRLVMSGFRCARNAP
ncbi:MAG: SUMF1/EgtB/PvdO family nonheme iron enzyme [Polyangiaceae bacterium]